MKKCGNVRNISFVFLIILGIMILPMVVYAETYEVGDVNKDGQIDVLDVVLVVRHVIEFDYLNEAQQNLADVNADGIIDVKDVTLILRYVLGLIKDFNDESLSDLGESDELAQVSEDSDGQIPTENGIGVNEDQQPPLAGDDNSDLLPPGNDDNNVLLPPGNDDFEDL